ncbi:MAG: hypothetical protein CVU89_13175 [Firmicutes bacterium HGW-Firmicutes-14]|nr:MAG: hypothetical protein CVU89_13175 [Firmicutes bacterium HGW-Firmicutes-14]
MFRKKWQLTLSIAFACLGLLLSLQFRTHKAMIDDLNYQSNETLATIARNLQTQYYQLIQEVWDLRTQLKLLEQNADQNKTALEALTRERQKLNTAIGATPVEGPGLVITVPENEESYFGYQDVVDIVNELWNAGAEAVSVNGFRVTNNTSLLPNEDYSAMVLNGIQLSAPYVIKAIGEPAALEKGISIPSGIIDKLISLFKVPLEIQQVDKINLPAANVLDFNYAQTVTAPATK